MAQATESVKEAMRGVEAWLAPIFSNFPHLPEGGRKFIVHIAPWVALIIGILGIVGLVVGGVLASIAGLLVGGYAAISLLQLLIPLVLSVISVVLLLMAYPGLRDHKKIGWNYVFYAEVISVLGSVVSIAFGHGLSYDMGSLLGTIIGTIIGFWILFEIRPYYLGLPVASAPTPAAAGQM